RAGVPRGVVDVEADPGPARQYRGRHALHRARAAPHSCESARRRGVPRRGDRRPHRGRRGALRMGFYPIALELEGRPCLVVGGGAVAVAGSTGGTSPGLARAIREELETYFTDDYRVLARLAGEARCALRGSGAAADADAWCRALDPALRRLIAEGREDEARARLLGR